MGSREALYVAWNLSNRQHCRAFTSCVRWCLTWTQTWRWPRTSAPVRNRTLENLDFRFQTQSASLFLHATAFIAHLSHRSSVRLSVCMFVTRVDQSKTVQAWIANIGCLEDNPQNHHCLPPPSLRPWTATNH